jgi:L-ascorbate metabolism protein UlaG (beta-lactamase superfamily)
MAKAKYETDTIQTNQGDLVMTFLGHGTLLFTFSGKNIHVDPIERVADYSGQPKADLILVTHHHSDHLDAGSIRHILKDDTGIVLTAICAEQLRKEMGEELEKHSASLIVMKNGDRRDVDGIPLRAVPAYNRKHMREANRPFHIPGEGNGYVISFGEKTVYVAGDTEDIPEMKQLGSVDVAFLPMNLPYTMTPGMVAQAVEMIRPGILYPYHFGQTDTDEIVELLKHTETDVRIRSMA